MRRLLFLLLAGAVATQTMAAPPTNQPAPDMALLGAASPTLSGLRNRARVVVLFSPAGKVQGIQGMKWNAQRKFFGEPATVAGLAERNVTVVVVSDKKESWPRSLAIARPAGDVAKIRAAYHVSEGQFLAVLVGLDGEVKDASTQPFQGVPLFAQIDAMPGRQRQMRGER